MTEARTSWSVVRELIREWTETHRLRPIGKSTELERVMDIPRRLLDLSVDLTARLATGNGGLTLRPIQSAALAEAELAGGLLAPIGVGEGKTFICELLPVVMESACAVLLIPAQLKRQRASEAEKLARHFRTHPSLHVFSHEEISLAKNSELLDNLRPDLVVIDEAHAFKAKDSARTKRMLRYAKLNPRCRWCFLSGTMTAKSLTDYAHLSELALRKNSPLPDPFRHWPELQDWARALDADTEDFDRPPPGALVELCSSEEIDWIAFNRAQALPTVRQAFRRRLVETPGVVATTETSLGVALSVATRRVAVPTPVADLLREVERTWKIGDEEIDEPPRLWAILRQLGCGFYYVWRWPGGQKDWEWLDARAAWHREVRTFLRTRSGPNMDSQFLLASAAASGRWKSEAWAAWSAVKDRPAPPVETVWVSRYLIEDAQRWLEASKEPGVVWYEHTALEAEFARYGLPVAGRGDAGAALLARTAERRRSMAASRRAHGRGKNLHQYARALVLSWPASGLATEQLIGRHHRPGQEADRVIVESYFGIEPFRRALEKSVREAWYRQDTMGQRERLLFADRVDWPAIDETKTEPIEIDDEDEEQEEETNR